MPTKIIVPLLGEGIEEVSIVNWLKAEGDSVEQYDGLVEIETDKVVTEIPSPVSGTLLQITVSEVGQTVPVGGVLAWIGKPGESIDAGDEIPAVMDEPALEEESDTSTDLGSGRRCPKPIRDPLRPGRWTHRNRPRFGRWALSPRLWLKLPQKRILTYPTSSEQVLEAGSQSKTCWTSSNLVLNLTHQKHCQSFLHPHDQLSKQNPGLFFRSHPYGSGSLNTWS